MKFVLEIDTSGAAFEDEPRPYVVAAMLEEAAAMLMDRLDSDAVLFDPNGNRVGGYRWEDR